jgi:hypothetical protein
MLFVHKTTYLSCANIHQEAWQVLARLADIRQPGFLGLARLANIRQPTFPGLDTFVNIRQPTFPGLARLADIRQRAFFEKNVTRLDTLARVICHFGEFGASGHCLFKFKRRKLKIEN